MVGKALRIVVFLLLATPVAFAAKQPTGHPPIFTASDSCFACHNGLVNAAGENVSIGPAWRASMMANASRDPYWRASVFRESRDFANAAQVIEHECAACHMPMSRYEAKSAGARDVVFAHYAKGANATRADLLAIDGVSCTVCHQMSPRGLGEKASFSGGFEVDATAGASYGRYDIDKGRIRIMRSAAGLAPTRGEHISGSALCASCHTLFTHSLVEGAEGELPEQVPYLEWRHSSFADSVECQACHLPQPGAEAPIASLLPQNRPPSGLHQVRGGNFVMPRILASNAAELQVAALPAELEETAKRTEAFLSQDTAAVTIASAVVEEGRLEIDLSVENAAGHKLPTGYPSRRVWLHLRVEDATGKAIFESGRFRDDGSIEGNDNDADATRYEPHYTRVENAGQVQIYEPVLVGKDGAVTTGLLTAVRYAKDNRLLPGGFDKETAPPEIAVQGEARGDEDFTGGGDQVRYSVQLGEAKKPYHVVAELWYQPIGYRWAQNLAQTDAEETGRFVRAYNAASGKSAMVIAKTETTVE